MKSYTVLNAMAPEMFLNPDNFVTGFDCMNPANAKAQYENGLQIGREYDRVDISASGTWSASRDNRAVSLTSYEGIGYHAHTASLLKGFLDSGVPVWVHRLVYGKIVSTRIK